MKPKLHPRKAKTLPPHTWELHPSEHLGGVRKSFVIAVITITLLVLISALLFFREELIGKAFELASVNTAGVETGLQVLANRADTIIPIRANIGSASTTALSLVMDLPLRPDGTAITCSDVRLVEVLPWGQPSGAGGSSAAFSYVNSCNNNQLTLEHSTLDATQAQTGVFTIANLIFTNGLPVGTYQFTASEFTIIDSSDPSFPVLNIPVGTAAAATVTAVQCNVDADCSAGQSCRANTCVAPSLCRNAPSATEATICPGDDQGLPSPAPAATLIADQAACTAATSCEFYCNEGYQLSSTPSTAHLFLVGGTYNAGSPAIPLAQEYDGASWQASSGTFTPGYLYGIWGNSANDVWIVGQSGRIFHYDGTSWQDQTNPAWAIYSFSVVGGSVANNIWAGGNRALLHYDGIQWNFISSAYGFIRGIWTTSPTNTWIIEDNGNNHNLLHGDGTAINTAASGLTSFKFNSVWGTANEAWIAGFEEIPPNRLQQAVIYHYDGNALTKEYVQPLGLTTSQFRSIWGSSATDLWAVGGIFSVTGTTPLVLRNTGSGWNVVTPPTVNGGLSQVWGTAANDVYVMGDGFVQRWDGTNWQNLFSPVQNALGMGGYSTTRSVCTPLPPPATQLYSCTNTLADGTAEPNLLSVGGSLATDARTGQSIMLVPGQQGINPTQSAVLTLSSTTGPVAQLSESCDASGNLLEYYCSAASRQYVDDAAAQQGLGGSVVLSCGQNYQCLNGACVPREICTDNQDNDNDGLTDCSDTECASDVSCLPPACGNGILDTSETCDASVTSNQFANNADCVSQGYVSGTLACSSACALDESQCVQCNVDSDCPNGNQCLNNQCVPLTCSNGVLDAGEACDASIAPPNSPFANNADCVSQGFVGGTLACSNTCALNQSQCVRCNVDADCPAGQQCSNNQCTVQTQALPAPSGGGSPSRGGYVCNSRWNCGTWSYCTNELKQTRTCVDINRCEQRPRTETQPCSSCDESWVCSEWSSCQNSQQTRTCTDEHSCGTQRTKPSAQQACQVPGRVAAPPAPIIPKPLPPKISFWDKYKLPILAGAVGTLGIGIILLLFLTKRRKKKAYNLVDLAKWIDAELRMGTSLADVKQILKDQTGWTATEIESALKMLQSQPQE